MSDLLQPSNHWHLWTVAAVLGLMALNYLTRFVWPALQLQARLSQVNAHLAALSQKPPGTPIDLAQLKDEVMTSPTLQHAWQQYASTLHPRWQAADADPLNAARQRVNHLSGAFFAHMGMAANGGRLDLSQIEQRVQSDPALAQLWTDYNLALEALQPLEMAAHHSTGLWQAHHPADHHFTEQALVDTPLRSNFYKHVPGILTGVGIIGTFTGLIAGLIGFDVSQPERVQTALSQLVQTVGHAFLVSALAITLAMVFTWVEKSLLTSRYRQVEELQQGLDTLFTPQDGAQYLERLTLATEMQAVLSTQILNHLRASAPNGQLR